MESCRVIVELSVLVTVMETGFQGPHCEHEFVPELIAAISPPRGRIILIRIAAINAIITVLTCTGVLPVFFVPGRVPSGVRSQYEKIRDPVIPKPMIARIIRHIKGPLQKKCVMVRGMISKTVVLVI